MSFFKKNRKIILFLSLFIVGLGGTGFYLNQNYTYQNQLIESVEIVCNSSELNSYIYLKDIEDVTFDYKKLYRSKLTSDSTLFFDIKDQTQMRNLRWYFKSNIDYVFVKKIRLHSKDYIEELDLSVLKCSGGLSKINYDDGLTFKVEKPHSFLEIDKTCLYPTDIGPLIIAFLLVILILTALFFLFDKISFQALELSDISVLVFLASIFMPHPIFNVALILSLLFVLKNFEFKRFYSNRINLIFIAYFLLLFLNDLFISSSSYHNLKATETFLPFLIMPIYISCVNKVRLIRYFPFFAILIGGGLLLTSIINALVFRNLFYISFTEFTKYIHPVYYSYLISFSIFYVALVLELKNSYKNIIQIVLFLFMILAGSKLIIILTISIYLLLFIKNKKLIITMSSGIIFMFLFPPIQERFKEIVNINDIDIVLEKVIDENDYRVNGLTLRLLLWQETFKTINTIPKFIFGLGVDDASNNELKLNMIERGLGKYKRYSTHNQFVNIYMRAGIIGLGLLISMVVYIFYRAMIKKNKMLLVLAILFTFTMLTESVLQRVVGIYFFTTVILFLMKPTFLDENSNNWN